MIALLGKDLRRGAQDELELLIVTGRKPLGKFGVWSLAGFGFSFDFISSLRSGSKAKTKDLQPYILKLKRLAFDAGTRRRDPVRDLSRLRNRMHQAANIFAIGESRQPLLFTRSKFRRGDQISLEIKRVTGVLAEVPVKARVR